MDAGGVVSARRYATQSCSCSTRLGVLSVVTASLRRRTDDAADVPSVAVISGVVGWGRRPRGQSETPAMDGLAQEGARSRADRGERGRSVGEALARSSWRRSNRNPGAPSCAAVDGPRPILRSAEAGDRRAIVPSPRPS